MNQQPLVTIANNWINPFCIQLFISYYLTTTLSVEKQYKVNFITQSSIHHNIPITVLTLTILLNLNLISDSISVSYNLIGNIMETLDIYLIMQNESVITILSVRQNKGSVPKSAVLPSSDIFSNFRQLEKRLGQVPAIT